MLIEGCQICPRSCVVLMRGPNSRLEDAKPLAHQGLEREQRRLAILDPLLIVTNHSKQIVHSKQPEPSLEPSSI